MYMTQQYEKGFTLIELMVTLVIALVILAGMTAVFISQTRAAHTVGSKTEIMGDLYLASQIMQSELRGAKAVCWNPVSNILMYQPIDSPNNIVAACNSTYKNNSWFKYVGTTIRWYRGQLSTASPVSPAKALQDIALMGGQSNQELLRGISGFVVTPAGNADLQAVREVILSGAYKGSDHVDQTLNITFKVWPRN